MQQSEILSLVERLIPAYGAPDFEQVLNQLTSDAPPSAKVLVKMELNRVMAPCNKTIDLRGKVQGECRAYELNGKTHWLDDIALNAYHRKVKRFGGFTEGVWEALVNTRNNYRVMQQRSSSSGNLAANERTISTVEPIHLGLSLKRQEKRLRMSSQIKIALSNDQEMLATSVDLSNSGMKLKLPTAFEVNLGEIFQAEFVELYKTTNLDALIKPISYRIIGIDDHPDNDSIRYIRAIRLDESEIIGEAITLMLDSQAKKANHDNQDKVIRARTHSYENIFIRNTPCLPLFFSDSELKFALLNEHNQKTWNYWHDERNQPSLSNLFHPERIALLTKPGIKTSSNVIYAFIHEHKGKSLHYSMMLPEADRQERQLFWHLGARRASWRVFRLHMFELNAEEIGCFINSTPEYAEQKLELTHLGILQEISDAESRRDYLLTEKPSLEASVLKRFRHPRNTKHYPRGIYFDAVSRRKEQRFSFQSPIELQAENGLQLAGKTVNFSTKGLSIQLTNPIEAALGQMVSISFKDLQRYDMSVPLSRIPYQVVRVSPDGRNLQLSIEDSSRTNKTTVFLKKLISHNKDKLAATPEIVPSIDLLDAMYDCILTRLVCTPIYIAKQKQNLAPVSIGVNYPLAAYFKVLTVIGNPKQLTLEPIYKKRSSRLLKVPLRPVSNPVTSYHEIYFAVIKSPQGEIETIYTRLLSEFTSLKERLRFIKKAKQMGEFYAFRISAVPINPEKSELLSSKLKQLETNTIHHMRALEKEFKMLFGYSELIDISEEVLIRLELT